MRTSLEITSERKKKSLMKLVEIGFYPVAFALLETERFHDNGQLLDKDYEELAEYLEKLLEPVEEETNNEIAPTEENIDDFNNTSRMTFDV